MPSPLALRPAFARRFGFPARAALSALCVLCVATVAAIRAADDPVPEPMAPRVAAASPDAQRAIAGFRVPRGLEIQLVAANPMVSDIVAFALDEKGRIYVCESFRQKRGVTDNRDHNQAWVDADLASKSVDDRIAYHKRLLGTSINTYMQQDDRIRLLEDTDGDGVMDKATTFADHFNGLAEGTMAGVLPLRNGNVFATCIPNLWLLKDTDGDGKADVKKSLYYGFGNRVALRGHDMHGLRVGPDGRIYFSIGDRALNVNTPDGRNLANLESGAVLRCEMDGSKLEIFATGLRNPQELAFDDYGNLFTGDNNSDSGDKARWVYVVEGGDTGWRMAYQYLSDRGPFNRERLWYPYFDGQPAFIVPPIANFGDGPSGLVAYPGVGLPERFKGTFFMCDFRGGAAANSGVRACKVKPKGAGFEQTDTEQFFWSILPTDVDFGPDCAMYVSDWVNGWEGQPANVGRIYRVIDPQIANSPAVKEVKQLLAEGMAKRPNEAIVKLLAHADRRVRMDAQFELAAREELELLIAAAREQKDLVGRLHAVWGIGQIARHETDTTHSASALRSLLADKEEEVRAQAAKMLGELEEAGALDDLVKLLKDSSSRVRYFAAVAIGHLGRKDAIGPLQEMLAENKDADPWLRHGGVMGLAGTKDVQALVAAAKHSSPSARMGVLLALRRLNSPQVALFLQDANERLVTEAARAIHDVPIDAAMPQLAALLSRPVEVDTTNAYALAWRVANASYKLGTPEQAAALAAYAARANVPDIMRTEAVTMLANWATPSSRDRIQGIWRPIAPRNGDVAVSAFKSSLASILSAGGSTRQNAASVAARFGISEVGPFLKQTLSDTSLPGDRRADALDALAVLQDSGLNDAVKAALTDADDRVRAQGRRILAKLRPAEAVPVLAVVLNASTATKIERQAALDTLASVATPEAGEVVSSAFDQLAAGKTPAEIRLDVLLAARQRSEATIKEKLDKYEAAKPADDPLAPHREALVGGDAELGRRVFFERGDLQCVRCHKVNGTGGEVGPDLSKVSADKQRDYLLEAIVVPNKTIAKGFDSMMIVTDDGRVHVGIVKSEDAEQVQIITAEGNVETLKTKSIEDRKKALSPMPEDLYKKIAPRDLRNLIEFLATLK